MTTESNSNWKSDQSNCTGFPEYYFIVKAFDRSLRWHGQSDVYSKVQLFASLILFGMRS